MRGLEALDEAQVLAARYGEYHYAAELYRLQGELLIKRSADADREATACLQQALSISQQQQARGWELRAATSLARLRQSRGEYQEAYDLLAPVYGWFTEGFNTADLNGGRRPSRC